MKTTILSTIVVATALFSSVATSHALTFDLPITFPQAGTVTLTLDHSSGGFDHLLFLGLSPTPIMALTDLGDPSSNILGFTPATIGDTVPLGSFNAGEELIFWLVNVESHRLGTPGTIAGGVFSGSGIIGNPPPQACTIPWLMTLIPSLGSCISKTCSLTPIKQRSSLATMCGLP